MKSKLAKLASSSETAFFANFEALNFVNVESAKMHKNQNSEPLNVLTELLLQDLVFHLSRFSAKLSFS